MTWGFCRSAMATASCKVSFRGAVSWASASAAIKKGRAIFQGACHFQGACRGAPGSRLGGDCALFDCCRMIGSLTQDCMLWASKRYAKSRRGAMGVCGSAQISACPGSGLEREEVFGNGIGFDR